MLLAVAADRAQDLESDARQGGEEGEGMGCGGGGGGGGGGVDKLASGSRGMFEPPGS